MTMQTMKDEDYMKNIYYKAALEMWNKGIPQIFKNRKRRARQFELITMISSMSIALSAMAAKNVLVDENGEIDFIDVYQQFKKLCEVLRYFNDNTVIPFYDKHTKCFFKNDKVVQELLSDSRWISVFLNPLSLQVQIFKRFKVAFDKHKTPESFIKETQQLTESFLSALSFNRKFYDENGKEISHEEYIERSVKLGIKFMSRANRLVYNEAKNTLAIE